MGTVFRNSEGGFSLIEFLVAILIMSVGLLGLLQTLCYSIEHNMRSQLRDAAIRLADERMATEKSKPYESIGLATENQMIKVPVANCFENYSVVKSAADVTDNTKKILVRVSWRQKGMQNSHAISSLVTKTVQ